MEAGEGLKEEVKRLKREVEMRQALIDMQGLQEIRYKETIVMLEYEVKTLKADQNRVADKQNFK